MNALTGIGGEYRSMMWLPFYERIKMVRLDHGLSMKAMAESVGVTAPTWSNYEKDITFPSPATCWNIQCIYHVKEEWLMTGGGEPYEDGYKPGDPLGEKSDYMEKVKRDAQKLMRRMQAMNAEGRESKCPN